MKCFYHNDADGKCAGFWVHIDELDKMPDCDACTGASQYLEEYIDRLKDMKVDM